MTTYLVVENDNRELISRVMIAGELAAAGIPSIIGQQKLLANSFEHLKPGVIVLKGMNQVQANIAGIAQKAGHTVCAIDEEAMGLDRPDQAMRDVTLDIALDAVFTSSPEFAGFYAKLLKAQPQVHVTGNPRFDILRNKDLYKDRAADIREKAGDFILINTNCGGVNSAWGGIANYIGVLYNTGWVRDPSDITSHLIHDMVNMKNLAGVANLLIDSKIRVLIRPHPSENGATWGSLTQGRCGVVGDDWHVPWMEAASLVVHAGCTTGLEASIMGKPSMSILSGTGWDPLFTSNKINPVSGIQNALNSIKAFRTGLYKPEMYPVPEPGAHKRIAAAIAKFPQGSNVATLPIQTIERSQYERSKCEFTEETILKLSRSLNLSFGVRTLGDSVVQIIPKRQPKEQTSDVPESEPDADTAAA